MSGAGVATLLQRIGDGDRRAEQELLPLVHGELHSLAETALRGERPEQTLQAAALVHELWLRFAVAENLSIRHRAHFLRVAARGMRVLVVEHARVRRSAKRDIGPEHLAHLVAALEERSIDVLALQDALERLAAMDDELARLVELRYFAGLSIDEVAEALGDSPESVDKSWRLARAWLRRTLPDPPR